MARLVHVISKSVEVYAPWDDTYNWFHDQAKYEGECDWSDEGAESSNKLNKYNRDSSTSEFCAEIASDWYNVDTIELFDEWWASMVNSNNLEAGDCDGHSNLFSNWGGTIEMYHYE